MGGGRNRTGRGMLTTEGPCCSAEACTRPGGSAQSSAHSAPHAGISVCTAPGAAAPPHRCPAPPDKKVGEPRVAPQLRGVEPVAGDPPVPPVGRQVAHPGAAGQGAGAQRGRVAQGSPHASATGMDSSSHQRPYAQPPVRRCWPHAPWWCWPAPPRCRPTCTGRGCRPPRGCAPGTAASAAPGSEHPGGARSAASSRRRGRRPHRSWTAGAHPAPPAPPPLPPHHRRCCRPCLLLQAGAGAHGVTHLACCDLQEQNMRRASLICRPLGKRN